MNISDDEYAALRQKADAWDSHVRRRLEEGFVRGETTIELIGVNQGQAEIRLADTVIVTPFGRAQMRYSDSKYKTYFMHPIDQLKINHEIKLTIS